MAADPNTAQEKKPLLDFFRGWAITSLAVLVAAKVTKGIETDDYGSLLVASLLLGVLNAVLRPILLVLALPLLLLSLGLFYFVINAGLLLLVGKFVKGFHVDGFGAAFLGALVISFTSTVANALLGGTRARVRVKASAGPSQNGRRPPPPPSPPAAGSGPVIDI